MRKVDPPRTARRGRLQPLRRSRHSGCELAEGQRLTIMRQRAWACLVVLLDLGATYSVNDWFGGAIVPWGLVCVARARRSWYTRARRAGRGRRACFAAEPSELVAAALLLLARGAPQSKLLPAVMARVALQAACGATASRRSRASLGTGCDRRTAQSVTCERESYRVL